MSMSFQVRDLQVQASEDEMLRSNQSRRRRISHYSLKTITNIFTHQKKQWTIDRIYESEISDDLNHQIIDHQQRIIWLFYHSLFDFTSSRFLFLGGASLEMILSLNVWQVRMILFLCSSLLFSSFASNQRSFASFAMRTCCVCCVCVLEDCVLWLRVPRSGRVVSSSFADLCPKMWTPCFCQQISTEIRSSTCVWWLRWRLGKQ